MNLTSVLSATLVHLRTTFLGVLFGCVVGLPAAVLLMKYPKLSKGNTFIDLDFCNIHYLSHPLDFRFLSSFSR